MARSAQDIYGSFGSVPDKPNEPVRIEGSGAGPMQLHANAEEFGGAVGAGIQNVGNASANLAKEFGDIYNDTAARDRVVQQSSALSDLENEYRKNKGLNAADAYKTFQQKAQELYANGGQGLSLGAQEIFNNQFSREMSYSLKNAGAWAADQTYAAQNTSLDAAIANNVNQMASAAGDPVRLKQLTDGIHAFSAQRAQADGLPPDVADMLISKNVGTGYAAAIKTMMKTDPDKAQELYQTASTSSFTATRQDANGNTVQVKVPFMDAAQQAQTAGEMKQISTQQEQQTLYDARSYAMSGASFNENAVSQAMRRNGKSPDDINAELIRLKSVQSNFGMAAHKYDIEKTLNDNSDRMAQGLPVTTLDPNYVKSVYAKEPGRAQDIIDENRNQGVVAHTVGQFTTQTPAERQETIQKYKPATGAASDNALDVVMRHEGGYVPVDGSSGAPAIYGINQKFHPTEYAEAKRLSDTQGDAAGQQYARSFYKTQYYDAKGIDKLPENTQAIVMDGVVNHTVAFGNKLIQAAKDGATPQQLIDMRREEYQRLADSDKNKPADQQKYAPSLKGWNDRLDDLSTGTQNFSTQSRLYSTLQKAESTYSKQLDDDPAGVLMKADPVLAKTGGDFKDPAKYGDFIDAAMKRQEAVGIPESARAALPASVATSLAGNITANPETAPAAISSLAAKTGAYWPQVYHSLVVQGGLPPVYQHIAQLGGDVSTEKDGALLAKWIGDSDIKGKQTADLLGGIDTTGSKNEADVKSSVRGSSAVQSYLTSIVRSGASKSQYAGALDAMDSLAYAKIFYERKPAAQAAQEAVDSFTSKYEFMPNGDARVPAANFDAVTRNAQQVLNTIEAQAVAPPIANTGFHGLRNAQDYYNSVRSNPTWVTTNNDTAIQLIDPWGHFVVGKDGKPLSIPFNAPAPQQNSQPAYNPGAP